jgi:hypothetical protein
MPVILGGARPPGVESELPNPIEDVLWWRRWRTATVTMRGGIAAARVGVALLWIQNVEWKVPPDFGENTKRGLYEWTSWAVDREVFAP